VHYARGIPQVEDARAYFHEEGRHNTYGVVVGVDLIPGVGGCWFLESNLNFGMSGTRSALYQGGVDPLVGGLARFARGKGYDSLVFVNKAYTPVNAAFAAGLEEVGSAQNLRVRLVEDVYLQPGGYAQCFGVPPMEGRNTLLVRAKRYWTSTDYLLDNKRATSRLLRAYLGESGEGGLLLPGNGTLSIDDGADPGSPYPNLVYKLPDESEGRGVVFMKAASMEEAERLAWRVARTGSRGGYLHRVLAFAKDRRGMFERFIRSPLLAGRRLYKVRAHILVAPTGVEFLGAHRVLSGAEVPEHLPAGLVTDARPYLVNLASGGAYEACPPAEEELVRRAALAVGRGLAWGLEYGYLVNEGQAPAELGDDGNGLAHRVA